MKEKYLQLQNSIDNAYTFMGAHKKGSTVTFSVYAPFANNVCLIGEFNGWQEEPMSREAGSVWHITRKAKQFDQYKFVIYSNAGKHYKSDPYAFYSQTRGETNSIVYRSKYVWKDQEYLDARQDYYKKPLNIYEVHLGSWKDAAKGEVTYKFLADKLVKYVVKMGYNFVEFMPITEYPLDASWGYQTTGYFSPTSRYGEPDGLKRLVDAFHAAGIGVILDWVPAHFCKDEHGLYEFDGSCLFESENPLRNEHKEWGTRIFDTSKPAVRSFLLSSVNYWLTEFHFDGVRVDAVASMLYLDYSRKDGEWQPNQYGGRENLDNIEFFKQMSCSVFRNHPHALLIAEESTAFPMVTAPADVGGLGFNFKWNMGWMNDTLSYFCSDFSQRDYFHDKLTFPSVYAYAENFILPFSHDEIVHGKRSLIEKQVGDYEQKFNGLKAMTAFMYAFPGKKLTFMGNEFAQFIEWNFTQQLDWLLLDYPAHKKYQKFVKTLNYIYKDNPALYERDTTNEGFEWIKGDDRSGVYAFLRKSDSQTLLFIVNTSPTDRKKYLMNIPQGKYNCILSTPNKKHTLTGKGEKTVIEIAPLSAYYFVKED